jgi:hypothetical protein
MDKVVVSQSFIKSLGEYLEGNSCGLQFKVQYLDKVEFPSSDIQRLGQWFEYQCTGQVTKFGHIPEPERLKPRKITKKEQEQGIKQEDIKGELAKKYRDMLVQVEAFKKMMQENDYEIIETGAKLYDDELGISGDVDIIVRKRGEDRVRFIDLKSSGLIDNKWDDLGWGDERLEYKDKLMIQAVHYKLLGIKKYGYEPDFYFWVFSNTNTVDRKNIKVEVSEDRFQEHLITINQARLQFNKHNQLGWIARPTPKRCDSCAIKDKCSFYVETPKEQVVYY